MSKEIVCLYHEDGSTFYCEQSSLWRIQDAVDQWLREGRDSVVSVALCKGGTMMIRASRIDVVTLHTIEQKIANEVYHVDLQRQTRDAIIEAMGFGEEEE